MAWSSRSQPAAAKGRVDEQHLDHSAIDTDKACDLIAFIPANGEVRDGRNCTRHIPCDALDIVRREKRVRCFNGGPPAGDQLG